MFWLADALTGVRREQDYYVHSRVARTARSHAFAEMLARMGRAVSRGARSSLRGIAPLVGRYRRLRIRRRTMRELRSLSDRTLKDIGLTRGEIPAVAAAMATGMENRVRLRGVAARSGRTTRIAEKTDAIESASEWQRAA